MTVVTDTASGVGVANETPRDQAGTGARRAPVWLAIVAASLPMFMAALDNLVMTNALPVLATDLGASVEQLQWFVNAYTLSFATFILMAVGLGDRFGRRTVFVIGIILFTAASVVAALSTDPGQLIVARALQGIGGASIMPLSLTLLAGSVSERLRPLAIGVWGGISGLGVAVGPLVGGAVVEGWSWQAIFLINIPIGILAVSLAISVLPNTFGAKVRADIVGLLLAAAGVLGIVFGIVRGNEAGWGSFEVGGSLIAGASFIAGFVWWESRTAAPLLPLRLFRDRSFTVANLVGIGFSFGMFGAIFILIQYLQVVAGSSPLEAAIQTTPWTLAPMVVAPLAGFIAPRVGTRILLIIGLALEAIALFWIVQVMATAGAYSQFVMPFVIAGIGMGLVFAPSSTAVLATMSERDTAKASGTNGTLRELGVALGIAVLTAVFTGANGALTPTEYLDGAVPAITVAAWVLLSTMLVAFALPAGRARLSGRQHQADAHPEAS